MLMLMPMPMLMLILMQILILTPILILILNLILKLILTLIQTLTDTDTNSNGYSIYCKIQYDDGSKNTDMSSGGYLLFANAPGNSWDTIPCYAIDDDPPPDGARQMKYKDPANKEGQRIFCEGKLGTITNTSTYDYSGSMCKIQYNDGSKNTDSDNDGSGYLRFANAPGNSYSTIPCYAIDEE